MDAFPVDWEVVPLSNAVDINPQPLHAKPDEFFYIDLESVKGGHLLERNLIGCGDAPSRAQRQFENGDILFQMVRPYQKNNLLVEFDARQFIASTGYAILHPKSGVSDGRYVYASIHRNQFVEDVLDNCTGSSYPAINPKKLGEIPFPLPPLPEQRRIAAALGDMDKLIDNLSKRIVKKNAIKQGAMQELLTGRKRLPGFDGCGDEGVVATQVAECVTTAFSDCKVLQKKRRVSRDAIPVDWGTQRVSELGQIVTGSTPPRTNVENWKGNFPWISAKDFTGKYIQTSIEHVSESGKSYCRVLPSDSVLITCIASIGLNAICKMPCATNQQINAVICRNCDVEYFYYCMDFSRERFIGLAGQTAVPIINKQQFADFTITLPTSLPEQRAIAKVLGDMDAEIAKLEAKRGKLIGIKKGMMSDLLTGRVRLKDA